MRVALVWMILGVNVPRIRTRSPHVRSILELSTPAAVTDLHQVRILVRNKAGAWAAAWVRHPQVSVFWIISFAVTIPQDEFLFDDVRQ